MNWNWKILIKSLFQRGIALLDFSLRNFTACPSQRISEEAQFILAGPEKYYST